MKLTPIFSPEDYDLHDPRWYGSGTAHQYPKRTVKNDNPPPRQKLEYAHILVIERMLGRKKIKGEIADHINGNTLDCRRENLRITNHSGNQENLKPKPFRGVTFHKKLQKWQAQVQRKGLKAYLGIFPTRMEAAEVAAKRRKELNFMERCEIK